MCAPVKYGMVARGTGPDTGLADRRRLGLTGGAHQSRWNLELPRWPVSPRRGKRLARQVSKRLLGERDTVRIMGIASQRRVSALHPQASDIYIHIEERPAVRFDQCPFLTVLLFEK